VALRQTLTRLHDAAQTSPDPATVIGRWQAAVSGLYDIVLRNLEDYVESNLLSVNRKPVTRFEEHPGTYEIDELHLTAGPESIIFSPVGTQIIGGHGRIDVYRRGYSAHRYMLIWNGRAGNSAVWQIISPEHEMMRYSKQVLEELIDRLLTQG
jgi:hypothetical protein